MDKFTAPSGPHFYPNFTIEKIQNPNKFYAIPIIGFLAKIIMLIPVLIWLILIQFGILIIVCIVNPFVVLFTKKYWEPAYEIAIGYIRYSTKAQLFSMV